MKVRAIIYKLSRALGCNKVTLGSLKRDAETKQQISEELKVHYNTSLVKSLKGQIDILQSEVYFLQEELREKSNLFKILMKSKISDNKCHNIDTNNQNDKIPESAPSELRHPQPIKTTTKISAKIKMTKTLITVWQTTSILIVGAKTTTKI